MSHYLDSRGTAVLGAGLLTLGLLFLGCKVDPTYNGEKVACDSDADCADLPGGDFECDLDAGLCVRVGKELPCVPECEHGECVDGECVCVPACEGGECVDGRCVCDPECGEGFVCGPVGLCEPECEPECLPVDRCVDGECVPGELGLEVFEPEDGFWMTDTVMFRGEVLWLDDEGDLSVECGIVGGEAVEASVTGLVELEDGLLRSDWDCNLTFGDVGGSEIEVLVEASAGPRAGREELTGRRDTVAPEISASIELELGGDTVFEPQEVYVDVEVRDCWREAGCERPEGEIERLSVTLETVDPSFDPEIERSCSELGEAEVFCRFTLVLEPDAAMDHPAPNGAYVFSISATDVFGNTALEEVGFELSRTPIVELEVEAPEIVDYDGEEGRPVVRRDGGFELRLEVDRLDRVVVDEDGGPIAPRVAMWEAEEGGHCDELFGLSLERVEESGVWSEDVDAAGPCLSRASSKYVIAAVIEDKWTHRSDEPRDIDETICANDGEASSPNAACASISITRVRWKADICGEYQNADCELLTPAVEHGGAILAAVNVTPDLGTVRQELWRIDPLTGTAALAWAPPTGSVLVGLTARSGPVVDSSLSPSLAYLWLEGPVRGRLVALDAGGATDPAWVYPPFDQTVGLPSVRGLPAIGATGRLYVPISSSVGEGAVAVLGADGEVMTIIGEGLDFDADTSIALYSGPHRDRVAVLDPWGRGGKLSCGRGDILNCSGGVWNQHAPRRLGDVTALRYGYMGAFGGGDGEPSLKVFPWLDSLPESPWLPMQAEMTAGPVYSVLGDEERRIVLGTETGLVFSPLHEEDGSVGFGRLHTVELGYPVRSLSLDRAGAAYALLDMGQEQAARLVVVDPSLQTEGEIAWVLNTGPVHEAATPILADYTGGVADASLGILYLAAGGELQAFITDRGPASGWPNIRGCPSRQSAIE